MVKAAKRRLVLVGGGHSHVQVLRALIMEPMNLDITLVIDQSVAMYSGMVPGCISGDYRREELEIDVHPLARRAGVDVVYARATHLNPQNKQLFVEGRPPLDYDLISVNIGSTVAGSHTPGVLEHALPTRPIGQFVGALDRLFADFIPKKAPFRAVIVGSGASGVELAFCLDARLRGLGQSALEIILIGNAKQLLMERSESVRSRVLKHAEQQGVRVICGESVQSVEAQAVCLSNGERVASDLTIWSAGATAHSFGNESGLQTDERGFIVVDDRLQMLDWPGQFAVGDCAVLQSWMQIPKAGVYAVRQGPILLDNLRRLSEGRAELVDYVPQKDFLSLLNLGNEVAIGTKWGLAYEGHSAFMLKDVIDRRFMRKFQLLDASAQALDSAALPSMGSMDDLLCGGCAAKVPADPLHLALNRLSPAPPSVGARVGMVERDDVAVFSTQDGTWVSNVDVISDCVNDPYLLGQIAANNALSDLFAKGALPTAALAIVQLPEACEPESLLFQVLSGVRSVLDAEGIALLGGHSTVGERLNVGLSVWGQPREGHPLWLNSALKPGHMLLLTRPIGTGVLLRANMMGRLPGPAFESLVADLVRGNGVASRVAAGFQPSAATDVTGFGLAAHLLELLDASGCDATLRVDAVPLYLHAQSLFDSGISSHAYPANREVIERTQGMSTADSRVELLFDPQTAGGLLIAVSPENAEALCSALRQSGETSAAIIGQTRPRSGPRSVLIFS